MKRILNQFLSVGGLALLAMAPANATTIYDTLVLPTSIDNTVYNEYNYYAQSAAQGFVTPAILGGNQDQITVTMRMGDADVPNGGFQLELWSDAGNKPGAPLMTLSGSSQPATAGDYTYTGTQLLIANTGYWVVAGVNYATTTDAGAEFPAGAGASYLWKMAYGFAGVANQPPLLGAVISPTAFIGNTLAFATVEDGGSW